jgi:hypothetical protein
VHAGQVNPPNAGAGGTCLLVLGTHRSGTSMTAGIAEAAGFQLGGPLGGPADDNPRGFFEHLSISQLHDRLLAEVGLEWHETVDPLTLASTEQLDRWRTEIGELFDEVAGDLPLFCFKDPRALRFLPLWHEVLEQRGREVVHVVALRNPRHVAASLLRRNGLQPAQCERLWVFDHQLLLQHLQHRSPVLSFYVRVLSAPRALLATLQQWSGIHAERAAERVDAFVSSELDRAARLAEGLEITVPTASGWYAAMTAAGRLVEQP